MATHTLTSNRSTTWKVTGSSGTWIVNSGVKINTREQSGIVESKTSHDNKIVVNGSISSFGPPEGADIGVPIQILGTRTDLTLGASTVLTGIAGVVGIDFYNGAAAEKLHVTNHGQINAAFQGVMLGFNGRLDNDGRINAVNAVSVGGTDTTVVNKTGGVINGYDKGIFSMATGITKVTNHGLLTGVLSAAVDDGDGKLKLINDGHIIGNIEARNGSDTMDMRGGILEGELRGGKGNDTYIIDQKTYVIVEKAGEGVDTVKSTVSNTLAAHVDKLILIGTGNTSGKGNADGNSLTGNIGNNKLSGLAGNDRLWGGKGSDTLTGGADADHFIFHKGDQADTIADFKNGTDKIDILDFGTKINDFGDLAGKITQVNADVQINLGSGDKLLIKGALVADFDATDFLFT